MATHIKLESSRRNGNPHNLRVGYQHKPSVEFCNNESTTCDIFQGSPTISQYAGLETQQPQY
eukprot:Ihof_evm9s17 gene=Ihof_evmTU9s17